MSDSWQAPPTFVDGTPQSASQLNILSDNLSFLKGYAEAPRPAFSGAEGPIQGGTFRTEWEGGIRHKRNDLHFILQLKADGDANGYIELNIYYADTIVVNKTYWWGTDFTGDWGTIDTTETLSGLTVGTCYRVRVRLRSGGGLTNQDFRLRWLAEEGT